MATHYINANVSKMQLFLCGYTKGMRVNLGVVIATAILVNIFYRRVKGKVDVRVKGGE